MTLAAGTRLGPYEILARLGAGGMGEVWKARDTRLNRTVAIKRLAADHAARFEREARAIAALNHPHICQIYDVGPDYLVMEYVEGAPVKGPMPLENAVRVALQVASALEAAHAKGIIHRDLKPANILESAAGAKLLDFGLAKRTESEPDATQTIEGTVAGTAAYMSPEQARGEPLDPRSDIFSFGAVLHELLCGRRAFTGASTVEILGAVLRDEPAAIDAPPDVARIVHRCLRKQRQQRFVSVAELRAALEQVRLAGVQPSIAVLPFANMSRDPDDEYFSDGLAEEIINALVKVRGLKVIARTSAFAFKGQNTDIRKIAEILGVTNVLEGSVRRAGNRIRVTAQLIAAADGTHLWSERYDRQMEDLFAMQDEIASAIAAELKLKFAPEPSAHSRRLPNLQAYEAYLRYRQHQWGFTPESLQRSRECLEQAISLDPEFALPYVGLADHYFASTMFGRAGELVPRARTLTMRALELDPGLAEAHGMMGVLAGFCARNWSEGERWFRQAMARDPVPWHVRSWYSCFYLFPLGRLQEARREAERALEDNPLSQILHWCLWCVLEALGLEAEARAACEKAVELDPQFWSGWWALGLHHIAAGRPAEALPPAEKAFAISPPSPYCIGLLAGAARNAGETARADALLQPLPAGSQRASVALACCHLALGEVDPAVECAGKAIDEGYPLTTFFFVRPFERLLRKSPAWPALLAKLNLSDVAAAQDR
jgi:serine/threonine-protein kinase